MTRTLLSTTLIAALGLAGCASGKGVRIAGDRLLLDEHVRFETDQARIRGESHDILDSVVYVLDHAPGLKGVRVHGHTDSTGERDYNQDLSERRAQAVAGYLRKRGVEIRITAKGFGQTRPLCKEETARCHRRNRRVEFYLVRK